MPLIIFYLGVFLSGLNTDLRAKKTKALSKVIDEVSKGIMGLDCKFKRCCDNCGNFRAHAFNWSF